MRRCAFRGNPRRWRQALSILECRIDLFDGSFEASIPWSHLVDERKIRVGGTQSGLELQGRQLISVPMPGKIIAVLVAEGDAVEKGQGLVIVEAMKMENEVRSPVTGAVREIKVKPGDTVEGGAVLLVVE